MRRQVTRLLVLALLQPMLQVAEQGLSLSSLMGELEVSETEPEPARPTPGPGERPGACYKCVKKQQSVLSVHLDTPLVMTMQPSKALALAVSRVVRLAVGVAVQVASCHC